MSLTHEPAGPKILYPISSAEPNYFVHFDMRYPVVKVPFNDI